jgi:CBS domain-containing protein
VSQGLIALGIALVVTGWLDTGVWLAFLGWFLGSAARREVAEGRTRDALGDVSVGMVMTPDPSTVPSSMNLGELVSDVLPRLRGASIPIVDNGHLRGLITPELLRRIPPQQWWTTPVGAVAAPLSAVATASASDRLVDVLDRLTVPNERIVVVDSDSRVIGLITPTDIARIARNAALREAARSIGTRG